MGGDNKLETEAEVHEFLMGRHAPDQKKAVIQTLAKAMKSA